MAGSAFRLAAGVLFLSLAACSAAAPVEVPIEIAARILFVEGRISGQGPFRLILDTGATETVITPPVAERLGVRSLPVAGKQRKGRVDSVSLGGATVSNLEVYVFDPPQSLPLRLDRGVDYHGLLGYTFLSRFVVTLDYGAHRLRLVPPDEAPRLSTREGREALPDARLVRFSLRRRLIHAAGTVNGQGPVTFLVDTGSAEVLLLPSAAAKLGVRAERVAPGRRDVGFATLDRVALGDAVVERVPAVIHQLGPERGDDAGYQGILGFPFLSNFRMTIDYRDGVVALQKQ